MRTSDHTFDNYNYSIFELKANIELIWFNNVFIGLYFTEEEMNSTFHFSAEKELEKLFKCLMSLRKLNHGFFQPIHENNSFSRTCISP